MAHLYHPIPLWHHTAARTSKRSRARPVVRELLTGWLLGLWQSACRQAERPDRVVPRY